jgi:hypothetical protein
MLAAMLVLAILSPKISSQFKDKDVDNAEIFRVIITGQSKSPFFARHNQCVEAIAYSGNVCVVQTRLRVKRAKIRKPYSLHMLRVKNAHFMHPDMRVGIYAN